MAQEIAVETALEWFIESLPIRFRNALQNECSDQIEKAKQIEKEQIENAWTHGFLSSSCKTAEEFYNKKYKGE